MNKPYESQFNGKGKRIKPQFGGKYSGINTGILSNQKANE